MRVVITPAGHQLAVPASWDAWTHDGWTYRVCVGDGGAFVEARDAAGLAHVLAKPVPVPGPRPARLFDLSFAPWKGFVCSSR